MHEPEEGQPGSAQQIPAPPSTAGLLGTVFEGPAVSHEHDPSTLTYMSLQAMPPPPEEELAEASGETAGAQEPPCVWQSSSQVST